MVSTAISNPSPPTSWNSPIGAPFSSTAKRDPSTGRSPVVATDDAASAPVKNRSAKAAHLVPRPLVQRRDRRQQRAPVLVLQVQQGVEAPVQVVRQEHDLLPDGLD